MNQESIPQLKNRIKELEAENAQLKEDKDELRAFYENAPLPYQSLDQDGCFIDVHPNWLNTLGYKREEVIGEYFADFLHKDWHPSFEKNFPELKRRGYIHNLEYRMKHKKGHYIDVLFEGYVGYHRDGTFRQTYFVFKDISQHVKDREKLASQKERLANIIEGIDAGTWEWNVQTGETIFNERWAKFIGYTLEELSPTTIDTWMKHAHPDDLEKCKKELDKHFRGETDLYECEHRMKHKDGSWIWLLDRGKVVSWTEDGKPLWMFGTHQNITKRKQAEGERAESERKYRQLFENAPIGISQTDLQGQPIMQNDTMAHWLGFESSEEMMKFYYDYGERFYVDPQRRQEFLQKIKDQGYVKNFEYKMKRKDGSHIWLSLTANKLDYQDNTGVVIEGFAIDITDRKEAEFKLQKKYDELKTTEEELRASNEELQEVNQKLKEQKGELEIYKRMVESSEDLMAVLDADYNYISVNNAYLKYFQLNNEEVIGHTVKEVLGKNNFEEKVKPNLDKCFKGETVNFETVIQFPGKEMVNLGAYYYPLKRHEKVDGVVAVIRDITQRKRAEEALKKSEQQFRQLFKQAAIGIFIADINNNILDANEKALSLLGYSKEEMINMNAQNIIHPDDLKNLSLKENIRKMLSGEVLQIERRYCRKDGDYINVLINMGEIDTEENKNLYMVMFQDITERKQAEKELQVKNRISNTFIDSEHEDFYKAVLDILREVFDSEYGYFGYINDDGNLVAESMTRDVWDECQIKDKSIIFPKDTWGGLWGNALKRKKTLYQNGNLQFPQGHVQLQNAIAAPIVVNNKLIGQIALANKQSGFNESDKQSINNLCDYIAPLLHSKFKEDKYIHELLEAKEKAEESDRLKSAFLAKMSHEIRTPMNGIMGFSEMLQEKEFSKDERDKFLNIIHSRTHHLLNIINDLVDVSKIEANQLTLNFQQFCLNDVMKELYRVYKNQLNTEEKSHIELKVNASLDHDNSFIYSDPSRFRQIMDNLLNNAIKFTHEGSIEFGYELTSEDQLLFYVKDTGIGIPIDQQKQIFERFRQADDTTSRAYEGTGLGLTISKNLVELMGGEFWMDSKEGEGSVFYFTLPCETQQTAGKEEVKEEVPDETEGEDKTLLVIEDDPTSLEYMKALLEPGGFNIVACTTGKEGYEAFLNNSEIDLILMDIKLPDTTGLELTRKIRSSAHHSDVPIIAQTAYAMSEDARKSLDAGCDDYISKPIDKKKLLAKMYKFI